MIKKNLLTLTILLTCLLMAVAPLSPSPDTEYPKIETETQGDESETEPGITPLNDNESKQTTKK